MLFVHDPVVQPNIHYPSDLPWTRTCEKLCEFVDDYCRNGGT
jgi:hypothetical protein